MEPLRCISGCSLQKSSIQGLSGTTVIQFQITPSGQVTNVGVASSSGHGSLDQTAIAAARNMRFNARPGVVNNQFHRVNIRFGS
ncbi:MAG: energy transducer TonB [Limnothrix sp. RL_2_0]|nr:energy transducer TonB [Limnothrix sp. RL_2_0]